MKPSNHLQREGSAIRYSDKGRWFVVTEARTFTIGPWQLVEGNTLRIVAERPFPPPIYFETSPLKARDIIVKDPLTRDKVFPFFGLSGFASGQLLNIHPMAIIRTEVFGIIRMAMPRHSESDDDVSIVMERDDMAVANRAAFEGRPRQHMHVERADLFRLTVSDGYVIEIESPSFGSGFFAGIDRKSRHMYYGRCAWPKVSFNTNP